MNTEFVPYDVALALKELGFDEPCLTYYVPEKDSFLKYQEYGEEAFNMNAVKTVQGFSCVSAPLYQQAFRWFREKHHLVAYIDRDGGYWGKNILDLSQEDQEGTRTVYGKLHIVDDYSDTELALIREMISMVK